MIDVNELEKMCNERPDSFNFKKSGVLKLIEKIRQLEESVLLSQKPVLPQGWKIVPIEPDEAMIVAGFESAPDKIFDGENYPAEYDDMSGCRKAAFRAKRCYAAMLAAAPQPQGEQE